MIKHIFIWLFVVLGTTSVFAQKDSDSTYYCGTPNPTVEEIERLPWYGNNQFLYAFLEDLEGSKNERTERDFEGY